MSTELLSIDERNELERCEVVIKQGLEKFKEVGRAFQTISEKRLYRLEYSNFNDYCRDKWGMVQQTATRFIRAYEAVSNLESEPMGSLLPQSERQARPLTQLQPEIQREAWKEVVQQAEQTNQPITAAKVQDVVEQWKPINQQVVEAKENPMFSPKPPQVIIEEAKANRPHVANNSGENEWYTPEQYIESARRVMGNIDLDPASSEIANKRVGATTIFTKDDDGLSKDWFGNIWMNPPYAQPLISQFIEKLAVNRTFEQAIVLVNNATETQWGQMLLQASDAVCFHQGRIRFIDSNGVQGQAPLQGQMICYLGENKKAFMNEFARYGTCFG